MKEASGNGYVPIIAQAIEEMKAEWGDTFSLEQVNLAELEQLKQQFRKTQDHQTYRDNVQ